MKLCCNLAIFAVLAAPLPAIAQQDATPGPRPRLIISERAIAEGLAANPPAPPAMRNGDSLKNGAIIGAVLAGAGMAAFTTFLCNALQEPGDPPCWKGVLTVSAVAAGAGALAGAGIDALISVDRNGPVRAPDHVRRR